MQPPQSSAVEAFLTIINWGKLEASIPALEQAIPIALEAISKPQLDPTLNAQLPALFKSIERIKKSEDQMAREGWASLPPMLAQGLGSCLTILENKLPGAGHRAYHVDAIKQGEALLKGKKPEGDPQFARTYTQNMLQQYDKEMQIHDFIKRVFLIRKTNQYPDTNEAKIFVVAMLDKNTKTPFTQLLVYHVPTQTWSEAVDFQPGEHVSVTGVIEGGTKFYLIGERVTKDQLDNLLKKMTNNAASVRIPSEKELNDYISNKY